MTYNFKKLSSLDFEDLARDLLSAEWNVRLESFTSGRDSGIDLRYISAEGGRTIVQCKEFSGSGYSKLLSNLKNVELEKVQKLNPDKYVVVTSVGLTPNNKAEIQKALAPYIKNIADIIGASEIEALLRDHPEVEKAHYKLWLTSTAVLERVMHAAELCQTDIQIEKIKRKLTIFVQNEAYPRALDILSRDRVAIISGAPGIGKSTLAEMLIYAHLDEGYEPVVIANDLSEGRKFYRPDRKLLFYFDDFLGETYLGDRPEYLGKNQDALLADFAELIRNSDSARFVLTTREHILGGALARSEKLRNSQIAVGRCIIELSDYKRAQKARILFNHLYFSQLDSSYKEEIIKDDFFLTIIDHPNFNPRVIEWLSSYSRVKSVALADYRRHVKRLLDEPELIWAHAFDVEISNAARSLLVAIYTVGGYPELEDVQQAFDALHKHSAKKYNYEIAPNDFRSALKEIDGSFIYISKGYIAFINPSVRDFLGAVLSSSEDRAKDVVSAAIRFRQVASLWNLAEEQQKNLRLSEFLLSDDVGIFDSLERLMRVPHIRWRTTERGRVGSFLDFYPLSRAEFSAKLAERAKTEASIKLFSYAFDTFFEFSEKNWMAISEVINTAIRVKDFKWFVAHGGDAVLKRISTAIIKKLDEARAEDWFSIMEAYNDEMLWTDADRAEIDDALEQYRSEGVSDERANCDTIEELESLKDILEKFDRVYGIGFEREVERLEEKIQEKSSPDDVDEGGAFSHAESRSEPPMTDADIRNMFSGFAIKDQ